MNATPPAGPNVVAIQNQIGQRAPLGCWSQATNETQDASDPVTQGSPTAARATIHAQTPIATGQNQRGSREGPNMQIASLLLVGNSCSLFENPVRKSAELEGVSNKNQ
jgi:hypothetical protein